MSILNNDGVPFTLVQILMQCDQTGESHVVFSPDQLPDDKCYLLIETPSLSHWGPAAMRDCVCIYQCDHLAEAYSVADIRVEMGDRLIDLFTSEKKPSLWGNLHRKFLDHLPLYVLHDRTDSPNTYAQADKRWRQRESERRQR